MISMDVGFQKSYRTMRLKYPMFKEKTNKSCPLEYKISQGKWKNKNSLILYRFLHRCLNSYNRRVKGLHIHMKFQQMKMKASLVNDVSTEINRVTRCRGWSSIGPPKKFYICFYYIHKFSRSIYLYYAKALELLC